MKKSEVLKKILEEHLRGGFPCPYFSEDDEIKTIDELMKGMGGKD